MLTNGGRSELFVIWEKLLLGCKNTTLREIQSIIGLLNFACQVVAPGRPFCRRLIDVTCKVKKSWHKVRISVGMKKDLQVWLNLLDSYNGVSVILDHFGLQMKFWILCGLCWRNRVPEGFRYIFSRQMGPGFLAFRRGKKWYSSRYYVFRTLPSYRCYSVMGGLVEKQKGVDSYRQSVCCYHSKQKIVKIMQGHESGMKTGLSIPKVHHSN